MQLRLDRVTFVPTARPPHREIEQDPGPEARALPLRVPGLLELPVSVDWFAHHQGERLSRPALGRRIAQAVGAGGPVGVMFHHAVMDDAEMRRAAELLSLIACHERARPALMMELVACVASVARAGAALAGAA